MRFTGHLQLEWGSTASFQHHFVYCTLISFLFFISSYAHRPTGLPSVCRRWIKFGRPPPSSCVHPSDPLKLPPSPLEKWFTREIFYDLFPKANLGHGLSPCAPYSYEVRGGRRWLGLVSFFYSPLPVPPGSTMRGSICPYVWCFCREARGEQNLGTCFSEFSTNPSRTRLFVHSNSVFLECLSGLSLSHSTDKIVQVA